MIRWKNLLLHELTSTPMFLAKHSEGKRSRCLSLLDLSAFKIVEPDATGIGYGDTLK